MSYTRGPGVRHWHNIDTVSNGPLVRMFSANNVLTWPTADMAIYLPVIVETRVIVKKLWFENADTATGNYDIGLYDASGTAILRKGSAAKTAANDIVTWDCTDTTIGPGVYYLALACSTNSDTFAGIPPTAPAAAAFGAYSEASALPLPATATFAVANTISVWPGIGMLLVTAVS
jgi:hypothetical protein